MATYSRTILSQSTNGRGIEIGTSTTSGGTQLHVSQSSSDGLDEIWLYATQHGTTTGVILTISFSSVGITSNVTYNMKPAEGCVLVIPGHPLNKSREARAHATVANEISVHGWVNRKTP
jgi:hypothetical protein